MQSYFAHRPVNATFIGQHDFDNRLPDLSAAGIAELRRDTQTLLRAADKLPQEPLDPWQRIDRRLAEGYLQLQEWEIESGRFYGRNPSIYCGEATFGVMSLFLSEFAPLQDRVDAATSRMNAIPGLLSQCRDNIGNVPLPWLQQAITECRGARRFFSGGVNTAAGDAATADFLRACARSAEALSEFGQFLQAISADAPPAPAGCGRSVFDLHLRHAHCLDEDAESVLAYAEAELRKADAELEEGLARAGMKNFPEVSAALAALHPDVSDYYRRYVETWQAMRDIAIDNQLLSWPDFPVQYRPIPDWARHAAPDLYFLNYRSPAALGRPEMHNYWVTPIDASMNDDEQRQRLRANNDSVIKLNHVVHHGGIGHHVQNWHAFKSPSLVGRIAAVDCASRIAMHCGGTMAEGWACYATDLIGEFGGLTELESLAEKQTRRRMCARAIIDVRFHCGDLSFAEAVAFYVQRAGMSEDAATYEVTRNSMFPAAAMMYIVGCDAIHDLRAELAQRDDFDLCAFHDRFLSHGSIPVAPIADAMRNTEDET